MATFFALVFGCCFRGQPQHPTVIDETSRLIPTTTDTSNEQPRIVVVDHRKLKDRLGNIVRSKEGKMVNVNAQIPFNLHNQVLSPRFHPSLSRSTSLSTNNAYRTHGDHIPTTYPDSKPPSRHPSPSPSVQMTHSTAPSRRHSTSRSSSAYRGAYLLGGELEVYERNPILNVRLVEGPPGEAGVGGIPFGRRGRKRGRVMVGGPAPGRNAGLNARSGDDGPSILPTSVTDRQSGDGEAAQTAIEGAGTQNPSELTAAYAPSSTTPMPTGGMRFQGSSGEFVIHDAGDISRSWGD